MSVHHAERKSEVVVRALVRGDPVYEDQTLVLVMVYVDPLLLLTRSGTECLHS